jgi:hypothetical protein
MYNCTRGDQVESVVLFQIDSVLSIVRTPLYTNLSCTGLSVHAVAGHVIIGVAMYEHLRPFPRNGARPILRFRARYSQVDEATQGRISIRLEISAY